MDILVKVQPVSSGTTNSQSSIRKGTIVDESLPHILHVPVTSAQHQGLLRYMGLIKNGTDTSTVEIAITALGW